MRKCLLIIFVLLLLSAVLCSCNQEQEKKEEQTPPVIEHIYSAEWISLPETYEDFGLEYSDIRIEKNGKIGFLCFPVSEHMLYNSTYGDELIREREAILFLWYDKANGTFSFEKFTDESDKHMDYNAGKFVYSEFYHRVPEIVYAALALSDGGYAISVGESVSPAAITENGLSEYREPAYLSWKDPARDFFDYYRNNQGLRDFLIVWGADGRRRFTIPTDTIATGSSDPGKLFELPDGKIFYCTKTTGMLLSSDGTLLGVVPVPDGGISASIGCTPDGVIYARTQTNLMDSYGSQEVVWRYSVLDTETMMFSETDRLAPFSGLPDVGEDSLIFSETADTEFFSCGPAGFSRVGADGIPELLCSWEKSGMGYSLIDGVFADSAEKLFVCSGNPLDDTVQFCSMTPAGQVRKEEIVLAEFGYADMAKYAAAYNQSQDQVLVRIESLYPDTEHDRTTSDVFLQTLASGIVYDGVLFGYESDGYYEVLRKGVLCDLCPFLDAENTYTREAFIPSVLGLRETGDGALPSLITEFAVTGEQTFLPGIAEAVTLDAFADAAGTLPDNEYLYYINAADAYTTDYYIRLRIAQKENGYTNKQMLSLYRQKINERKRPRTEAVFAEFLKNRLCMFVDAEKGRCNFDTPAFRKLVSICRELPVLYEGEYLLPAGIRYTGEIKSSPYELGSAFDYLGMEAVNSQSSVRGIIGIPDVGYLLTPYRELAIVSLSAHKDAVWGFYRFYFSCQEKMKTDIALDTNSPLKVYVNSFPSLKTALRQRFSELETYRYAFDTESADLLCEMIYAGNTWENSRVTVTEHHVLLDADAEERYQRFLNLLSGIRYLNGYDQTVYDIVIEEISAYYAGAHDLDSTIKTIESRASLYLSEQK